MKTNRKRREGVAAVEAACCLPILVIIILSAIEISGGLFQEYNLQVCAFELSKTALQSEATCDEVQELAVRLLPQFGFENYSVEIEAEPRTVNQDSVEAPAVTQFDVPQSGPTTPGLHEIPRGTLLRLTIVADRPPVSGVAILSHLRQQVDADCVFVRER